MAGRPLSDAVLSPWSRSKDQLAAALQAGWQRTGYLSPLTPSSIELAEASVVTEDNPVIESRGETLAGLQEGPVMRMIRAAAQAQRAFGETPGRKVMLLISGNWVGCDEPVGRLVRRNSVNPGGRPSCRS